MREAFEAVMASPLFGVTLTLACFWLAQRVSGLTGRHPAANPVLIAMVLVAGVLLMLRTPYEDYLEGAQYIGFLLGPATVALGLPLYRQGRKIREAAPMVLAAVGVGCVAAIAAGYWITAGLGGTRAMALSMAPKSATTPISIALAEQIGGVPALTAIFTIVAGVVGAVAAPGVLDLLRIRDPRARGLAIGVSSHGVGTAQALQDDETVGAFSGLAMALNGLATSLVVGWLVPLL